MMLQTNNLDIAELIAAGLDLRSPKAAADVRNSAQQNIGSGVGKMWWCGVHIE
jgi:hypothetical protein